MRLDFAICWASSVPVQRWPKAVMCRPVTLTRSSIAAACVETRFFHDLVAVEMQHALGACGLGNRRLHHRRILSRSTIGATCRSISTTGNTTVFQVLERHAHIGDGAFHAIHREHGHSRPVARSRDRLLGNDVAIKPREHMGDGLPTLAAIEDLNGFSTSRASTRSSTAG